MKMKIKLLNPQAKLPSRGSEQAAGLDLYSTQTVAVEHGEITKVHTGIAVAVPVGYVGLIQPRSGLAFKHGVDTLAGTIDSDYRGELKVLLTNHEDGKAVILDKGERIAQFVIMPILTPELVLVDDLDVTERGDNGLGSSGRY